MSTQRYLHTRVATSSALLPVAIVLSLLLWFAQGISDSTAGIGFAVCVVGAALMLELNNANVLLRVRSRLVSATFIVIWAACPYLQPLQWAYLAALCLMLSYHALFHAYQQPQSSVEAFHSFLCIGAGGLAVPQLLLLAFPLVLAFGWFRALNPRTFCAMLLGLIVPFWIYGAYAFYMDSLPMLWERIGTGWGCSSAYYQTLTMPQIGMVGLLLLLDLVAIIHLYRFSYKDKIRTRLLFYFMAWMTPFYVLLIVVFPLHFNIMLALFVVNSSPLIAHYFALANGKSPRALFVVSLIMLLVLFINVV